MSNSDRVTSGPHTTDSLITGGEIVVQPLSATQWRIRDNRWPENDARSLVGFIEKRGEKFEVAQLDQGGERFWAGSLVEATAQFIDGRPEAPAPRKQPRRSDPSPQRASAPCSRLGLSGRAY
jgi:hypothetical protein